MLRYGFRLLNFWQRDICFLHGRFLFLECYCLKLQISNVQFLCSAIVKLMEVNQVLLLYETYLYLHTHCYSFSCSCLCLCLRWAMPCPILGHGLFGSTIFILALRFWRHRQRAFIIILHEYMHLHNAEAARIWSKVGYMQRENIVAAHVHARFLAQEKTVPAKGNAPVVYTQQCLRKAMQMYQARACTRHTMLAESNACTRHVYMHESDSHP